MWGSVRRDLYLRLFLGALLVIGVPYLVPTLERYKEYSHYFGEIVLYVLCALALEHRAGSFERRIERRFWHYLSLPFLFWAIARAIAIVEDTGISSIWFLIVPEIPYLFYYLFFFLASEARPDLPERNSVQNLSLKIRSAGFVILLVGAFAYFILIPGYLNPGVFGEVLPNFFLYTSIDAFIAIRFTQLFRISNTPRWRTLFGALALSCWIFTSLDIFEWVNYIYFVEISWGSFTDFLWDIPLVLIIVIGALKHHQFSETNLRPAIEPRAYGSPIILMAFTFPVVHFLLARFELLDPVSKGWQETTALACTVLLAALSMFEDRALRLRQAALENERAAARLEAEASRLRLRESEERFRSAALNMPVGMLITGADFRILECNPAILQLLGYTREELLQKTFWDITDPKYIDEEILLMQRLIIESEAVYKFSKQYLKKDGDSLWANVTVATIGTTDGTPLTLSLIEDVTERKHLETQLARSQRLEAIGQLAGGIAHDFNNLLTVIIGNSDFVSHTLKSDHACQSRLQEIQNAADRAASLTQQLLAFSSRQILSPKVLNLNTVIQNLEPMIKRLIGENIGLTLQLHSGLKLIEADPAQIEQVVLNLVLNSRDAIQGHGSIQIKTSNILLSEANAPYQEITVPGDYVLMQVSDTGCGIDKSVMEKIFEPFFTTKPMGKGTGLGLSTVYGIIKQSHGMTIAESSTGQGTTISVYLPRVEKSLSPIVEDSVQRTNYRGTESILIVEDEIAVRSLARLLLAEQGYRVLEANNSEHAFQMLSDKSVAIDLLLTDIIMPDINGPELAQKAKRERPDLHILFMSGYAGDAILQNNSIVDGKRLIEKPFTRKRLLSEVRATLDHSEPQVESCTDIVAPAEPLNGPASIMVVEDTDSVRNALAALLEMHNYHVTEAPGANEALGMIQQNDLKIHLLITDISMPGMSGFELATHVRKTNPELQVLFISGRPIERDEIKDFKRNAFLQKPFSMNSLIQTIHDLIGAPNQK